MSKYTEKSVSKVKELSGLAISEDGSFLWGVGDGGDLVKISTKDFKVTKVKSFDDDTEGITINRDTGDLLISMEPNKVGIVKKSSGFKKLETLFKVKDAKNFGNAGLEGITYYKNGEVYVGSQEGPYLWRIKIDGGEVLDKKRIKDDGIKEVADLCYDHVSDLLYIIDSERRKIFVYTGDASKHLKTFKLPEIDNPESISIDRKNNCVWVGDDNDDGSKLYKFQVSGL